MQRIVIAIALCGFIFLSACSGQDEYWEMQQRLHRLNVFNRSDSTFTSTVEAQALADYFTRHGTANEQMLAHYLLGVMA